MNWVRVRKFVYLPILAVFAIAAAVCISIALDKPPTSTVLIAAILLFLFPGVIGRLLLADLFAGRSLLMRGEHERSLASSRRFLEQLRRRPWLGHAIWTQFGIYTLNVEAMALNNAGAALLELRRLAEAKGMLQRATDVDPAYPIPVVNLAIIAKLDGDEAGSLQLAEEAARRGFSGGRLDAVVQVVGGAYARVAARV